MTKITIGASLLAIALLALVPAPAAANTGVCTDDLFWWGTYCYGYVDECHGESDLEAGYGTWTYGEWGQPVTDCSLYVTSNADGRYTGVCRPGANWDEIDCVGRVDYYDANGNHIVCFGTWTWNTWTGTSNYDCFTF